MRIALAAPTGKAAARLQEAVKDAKTHLPCAQEIKDRLPEEASTIHRLLRSVPDSAYFRHDADNPLPVDVVVIDEASMVDLALMAKLVAAIPSSARLILLGDKDQLASVEAGAVPTNYHEELCRLEQAAQSRQDGPVRQMLQEAPIHFLSPQDEAQAAQPTRA